MKKILLILLLGFSVFNINAQSDTCIVAVNLSEPQFCLNGYPTQTVLTLTDTGGVVLDEMTVTFDAAGLVLTSTNTASPALILWDGDLVDLPQGVDIVVSQKAYLSGEVDYDCNGRAVAGDPFTTAINPPIEDPLISAMCYDSITPIAFVIDNTASSANGAIDIVTANGMIWNVSSTTIISDIQLRLSIEGGAGTLVTDLRIYQGTDETGLLVAT
mgnify:CR=1 FL=1